ncbi:MAG: diacylglycerol kinase family lipid kinase [bacterium]|nr:diacylglycerol kinase family lipid kinase [bacterium]
MKYVFIINPASGKTDYNKIKENIMKNLENENYEIYETKAPKEATKIASRFKNEEGTVVYSVGGDGTLNEVINGIAEGKCKLGIIPTGSGNDFYRSLKESPNEEIRVDLGKVNDRYFINIASVGMDAETCNNANKIKSKLKIGIAYYLGLIHTFITFKSKRLKLKIDKNIYAGDYIIAAICNGKYYGGGFKIAPVASFDDNKFDIYLVSKANKLKLIKILLALLKSEHENYNEVRKYTGKNITISSENNLIVNIDGEITISKNIEIQMIEDAIYIHNDNALVQKIMSL